MESEAIEALGGLGLLTLAAIAIILFLVIVRQSRLRVRDNEPTLLDMQREMLEDARAERAAHREERKTEAAMHAQEVAATIKTMEGIAAAVSRTADAQAVTAASLETFAQRLDAHGLILSSAVQTIEERVIEGYRRVWQDELKALKRQLRYRRGSIPGTIAKTIDRIEKGTKDNEELIRRVVDAIAATDAGHSSHRADRRTYAPPVYPWH